MPSLTHPPTDTGAIGAERDNIGAALVAGLDAQAASVYRHAPLGLSNEEARAWYRGYDTRADVRPDPVPPAETPMGKALMAARAQIAKLRAALEPFAKIAGPIKGEAGRPTYLDAIMKGETEELAVTTIFDTGGRGAVLWADDFRNAAKALLAQAPSPATAPTGVLETSLIGEGEKS